jgi:2-iminobutanoate/2-iminopropanoate deaminase
VRARVRGHGQVHDHARRHGRWAEFNAVYLSYFDPDRLPARSAFGATGLALGGEVEIECVAYWPAER